VIEGLGELGGVACDFGNFVDVAGIVDPADADEADVKRRKLRVLEPGAPEEVAAADAEGGGGLGDCGKGAGDFVDEGRGGALVGVEDQDPGCAKGSCMAALRWAA
jgi:hypothetical protein